MKKHLAKLAILVMTILTLAGCLLVPVDDGYRRGGSHDRGGHRDGPGRR